MNHEHPLCAHLFHYDPCSDANTSFFALSSNIPFLVYITLVPDTHIADTQRPLPYCLTAAEMKKSPQLSELL